MVMAIPSLRRISVNSGKENPLVYGIPWLQTATQYRANISGNYNNDAFLAISAAHIGNRCSKSAFDLNIRG